MGQVTKIKILFFFSCLSLVFKEISGENPNHSKRLQENKDFLSVDDYYDYDGDLNSISEVPFCCKRHHYYDAEKKSCIKSKHLLEPKFYSMGGDEDKEKTNFENVTGFVNCSFFILGNSEFHLLRTGDLFLPMNYSTKPTYTIPSDRYCLIWTNENASSHHHMSALVCFPETNARDDLYRTIIRVYLLPILMGISACFLAVTFVVYLLVPELRDLLGKALMCSVASLCISKICNVITIILSSKAVAGCAVFGIAMHIGFLMAFFWLNVISFIVFFSTCRQSCLLTSRKNCWFLVGCFYAFGLPLLILILLLVHNFSSALNNSVVPKPGFSNIYCSFSNRGANIVYFYAPMAVLVAMNFLLFCFSACRLYFLSKQSSAYAFQFKHYFKLFLLMGIPWVFECLSYFFGEGSKLTTLSLLWLIFDIFNGLQGVVIFFVFVWRESVLARVVEVLCGSDVAHKKFPEAFQPHTYYEGANDHYQLDHSINEKKTQENGDTNA